MFRFIIMKFKSSGLRADVDGQFQDGEQGLTGTGYSRTRMSSKTAVGWHCTCQVQTEAKEQSAVGTPGRGSQP